MAIEIGHEWLHLYFDGELDAANSRAFEVHLDSCSECQAHIAELEALRTTIRADVPRHQAPESLRQRIHSSSAAPVARRSWQPLALAASWTAAFLLGGALAWTTSSWRATPDVSVSHDLLASHLRALAATSPVDVISTDRHTVKPWFAGKLDISPQVQDFASAGFTLVGGRIDYVGDNRVPVLVYRHGQHLVDVFVLPQSVRVTETRDKGYAIDTLMLGGQPAAVVSDLGDSERAQLLKLLTKKT